MFHGPDAILILVIVMFQQNLEIPLNDSIEYSEFVEMLVQFLLWLEWVSEVFNEQLEFIFESEFETCAPLYAVLLFLEAELHAKIPRVVD